MRKNLERLYAFGQILFSRYLFKRRWRQSHRFPATAGRRLVGVFEGKLRRHFCALEIHLGAEQKQHGFGIDNHRRAFVFHHVFARQHLVCQFDRVGHARTAAILDADAQADAVDDQVAAAEIAEGSITDLYMPKK